MDFFEDDDGLRECCGDEDVSVDPRLEDQRLDEALEMPFADYLDGYKKNPWYVGIARALRFTSVVNEV